MSKLLVVIGATGKQGGSVINAVLSDPTAKSTFAIRGVTRSVDGKAAQALKEQGVEVVAGDLNDKDSLVKAFKGAYAVFGVTDYWQGAGMDVKKEVQQGKNIVDAVKENDVQHFILSTLISPKKTTNGDLSKIYHFDGKDDIAEYAVSLNLPITFYLPGFYMSNIPGGMLRKDDASGKYVFSIPTNPDGQVPLVDIEADTGKFVKAALLNRDATLGKKLLGAQKYYTPEEIAKVFEETFPQDGKGITFQQTPDSVFLQVMKSSGMPDFGAEEMLENMKLLNKEYGYYNKESLDETHSLVTEKLTSWSEFLKKNPAYKDLK